MAEYTNDDVARLAEMVHPLRDKATPSLARRLLEQGVTLPPPPPDPAVVVAEALCSAIWGVGDWDFDGPAPRRLVAAVRDLFTTDAIEAAAAKVQGVQT